MYRTYAPSTEDIDNFRFAASACIATLLRGELEIDTDFDGELDNCADDLPPLAE
jgi:hypothetical protein